MTTATDSALYCRAVRRIYILILCFGLAGASAIGVWKEWRWGCGFLLGAAASLLNFRWLHQFVDALGTETPRFRKRLLAFLCLRYVLLGAGGYIIVLGLGLGWKAALFGLLVPVAAVLTEIVFELTHGA